MQTPSVTLSIVDLANEGLETLRNARFPVYAVPPSEWEGDVMVGGGWGETRHPLSVHMRYDDDLLIERPARRIDIGSTGLEGLSRRTPQERDLLWEFSYRTDILNFVHNIEPGRLQERPVPGSERFNATMVDGKLVPRVVYLESTGPRRLLDRVTSGNASEMECVAFDEVLELRLYRIQMPDVEVVVQGWGWGDEVLLELASKAQPIMETEGLYDEVHSAQHAAWEKISRRER